MISLPGLERLRRNPRLWRTMLEMFQRQSTNPSTLCVRFGLDQERYFVSWSQLSKRLQQRSYQEQIDLTEVEYCEDIGFFEA